MKTLYLEFEEKENELVTVAFARPTESSGEKGVASTSRGGAE